MPYTFLAHHELESIIIVVVIIIGNGCRGCTVQDSFAHTWLDVKGSSKQPILNEMLGCLCV